MPLLDIPLFTLHFSDEFTLHLDTPFLLLCLTECTQSVCLNAAMSIEGSCMKLHQFVVFWVYPFVCGFCIQLLCVVLSYYCIISTKYIFDFLNYSQIKVQNL